MNKDIRAFLADLSALTFEHGIKIEGCGCCGSPFILPVAPCDEGKFYTVDEDGDSLELTTIN